MKLKPYGYTTQAEWKKYLRDIRKKLNKQSKKTLIDFIIHLADNWHIFRESEKLRLYTLPKVGIKQKALPRPKRKTKRKFSRKQLAAQRLFAKRARAGTLKTMRGTREMLKREGRRRR